MSIATGRHATVPVEVGGREITFETGKLAKQADGAVVVRSGDTMILATAVGRTEGRPDADFFPLTVDVEEKMYAAGKIPGGFFKREGKASERATLTARMIDRPIRPLWPKGFKNEVQVICTVLSADMIHGHDVLCINGASAALAISPLPFLGPVGAVRVARIDGELVVNPTLQEADEDSDLDLIVVGTKDAVTMIEAGAKQVPEDAMLEAFAVAHAEIKRICEAIEDLRAQVGKPKWVDPTLTAELESGHGDAIWRRIQEQGLEAAGSIVAEIVDEIGPDITLDSTEEDIVRETQLKAGLALVLDKQRLTAVEGPVREQFESELRELTDAEQDSKTLKSRKRGILYDRIVESVAASVPRLRRRDGGQGRDDQVVGEEGGRRGLQGHRPQEDRRRQAPPGRPRHGGDPADQRRGRVRPADARLRPLHAWRDADPDALHARHGQGRPADRRPLTRERIAATCTTTTSRPSRSVRPGSCGGRSVVTSATVRSHRGRSRP